MKAFFKKLGGAIVSLWDGIRYLPILWREGGDDDGDENGV